MSLLSDIAFREGNCKSMGEYNLLIVDDNLRLCNAIAERFLQEGRFSVDICSSGTEALDFLKKNEADVALVDMLMPGMDGAEFMMQCREQKLGENTKFIALSSLTSEEVEHLFRIINMLKQRGCGIIYISHKMEEILRISDDVTIMRDGQWVATRPAKELTMDEIIRLMVGRPLTNRFPPKDNVVGDEDILKVEGLTAEYSHLKDANIHVRKGEILGVAGLDSSGRTELLENIFGSATRKSGKIYKNGKLVGNKTPRESIKNGFALVTEERRATGILGILDIRANTVIASLKKYLNGPFLSDKKMADATDSMIKAMRIKTPNQQTKINTLSGGNQQKVIFGRWILTQPDVLLLDEPTRGIDVGAKYEIYQLIQDLAKQGKAVVMVSSEMPELLGVCNRIVVMSGGRVAGEVDADNTTQEEIMTLAAKYA